MMQKRMVVRSNQSGHQCTHVSDDVTCPFCNSYSVSESKSKCNCSKCGQFWVL